MNSFTPFCLALAAASVANVAMPSSSATWARRSAERFTPTISGASFMACIRRILLRPINPHPVVWRSNDFMSVFSDRHNSVAINFESLCCGHWRPCWKKRRMSCSHCCLAVNSDSHAGARPVGFSIASAVLRAVSNALSRGSAHSGFTIAAYSVLE